MFVKKSRSCTWFVGDFVQMAMPEDDGQACDIVGWVSRIGYRQSEQDF